MLTIRPEQAEAIAREMEERFVRELAAHLRADFPRDLARHGIADGEVEPLVRRGLAEARGCGVVYEDDLRCYVDCMVILAPDFATNEVEHPFPARTLRRADLDGSGKMARISEYLIFGRGTSR